MKVAKWGQYAQLVAAIADGRLDGPAGDRPLRVAYRPGHGRRPASEKDLRPAAGDVAGRGRVGPAALRTGPLRPRAARPGNPKQGPAAMIERARDRQERLENGDN